MALGTRLEMRQGQSLVITPQLQQAIKLLQLSSIELETYLEAELERNPLLQRDEAAPSDGDAGEGDAPAESIQTAADQITESAAMADMDARAEDMYPEAERGEGAE